MTGFYLFIFIVICDFFLQMEFWFNYKGRYKRNFFLNPFIVFLLNTKNYVEVQNQTSLNSWNYAVACFFFLGLNPCSTNPCKNGGVCKIRHYNYFCICPPKFGGDNCEEGEYRNTNFDILCEGRAKAGICSLDTWAEPLHRLFTEVISVDFTCPIHLWSAV